MNKPRIGVVSYLNAVPLWYSLQHETDIEVYPDTPAAQAGLKTGDLVVALDGQPVADSEDLVRGIGRHGPGEEVTLAVMRRGKQQDIAVTLGERPDEETLAKGRFGTQR